jgi:hypothetical protein
VAGIRNPSQNLPPTFSNAAAELVSTPDAKAWQPLRAF